VQPSQPSSDTSALSLLASRLENSRDKWRDDPVGWVQHRLAGHLWSRQRDVAQLVVDHPRVAVRSGHAVGKTRLAATLACWWVDVHPPGEAIVVTTAPTFAQVSQVFWQEIRKVHSAAGLDGTITGDNRWTLNDGTLVALGRRPADWNPSALSGYHREHVLVIIDEACGVPRWLWDAADAITTTDGCRQLALGNPDDPSSHFAKVCQSEPGWQNVRIACTDAPTFTAEDVPSQLKKLLVSPGWVADKRERWGVESPLYRSKIEGEFADSTENTLVPLSWVRQAQDRWRAWHERPDRAGHEPRGRRIVGVDVGWLGNDATAICVRQGDVVYKIDQHKKMDTTQVTALVQAELGTTGSTSVIDSIGVGAGVLDQLRAAGASVHAFNASWATKRRDQTGSWKFRNVRSASWWALRELLDPAGNPTLALPDDDDLTADLITPTWAPAAGGFLMVESKPDIKKRLGRSPDVADALAMACWIDPPAGYGITADPLDPLDIGPRAVPYAATGQTLADWQPRGYGPPPGPRRVYGRR
jgi:hypothetical protein